MELTPERKAELEAENKALFAELRRRLSDRGITGIANGEFMQCWRGVPLDEPVGDPTLDRKEIEQLRRASSTTGGEEEETAHSASERAAWDAVHKKIAKEMDEAFVKNVAKSCADRDPRKNPSD